MGTRALRTLAVTTGLVASLVIPGVARAETCREIPGGTSGATLEAGGEEIRIPAVRNIELCTQSAGPFGGFPSISTEDPTGACWSLCFSVITTGSGGGGDGYVALRLYTDSTQRSVSVPVPGGGSTDEECLIGVGSPSARGDCGVKLSLDELPDPVRRPICVGTICVPPQGPLGGPLCEFITGDIICPEQG